MSGGWHLLFGSNKREMKANQRKAMAFSIMFRRSTVLSKARPGLLEDCNRVSHRDLVHCGSIMR